MRYGEEWFDDLDAPFEEADFEGFEFIASIEPKTDRKGNPLSGTVVNWKNIRSAGGADEKEAKAKAAAAEESEDDFEDIPF